MSTDTNAAVVGAFAGDEGKGKIVDRLAMHADYVVRAEGGANAGHTIQVGNKKIIGHLLPSGSAAGKICVIGRGVRLDIPQLLQEIKDLNQTPDLRIDCGALLSLSWHRAIEWWVEHIKSMSDSKTGTTMRGIGPIAATAALRLNVQVGMIYSPDRLGQWLGNFYQAFKPIFAHPELVAGFGKADMPEKIADELISQGELIEPFVCNAQALLYQAWKSGKSILFEGAQGLMLDPYWGTYGYNTTGLCTFAGLAVGTGMPITALGRRIGVSKLIATRVGNGPFPSELGDARLLESEPRPKAEIRKSFLEELRSKINSGYATEQEAGQYFRELAGEFGATTGRPRRTGWFDCAWLQYFSQINDPHEIALTKLDCLSGLKELKLVTSYRYCGNDLAPGVLPNLACDFENVEPVYSVLPGWTEDITGETRFDRLPARARAYIEAIENFGGCRIAWIGTGPDRVHLIRR